ncbi:MAG: patatin-like phospholipase family protein [Tractidigestivibacter sp.]|jgi:predicted patatin/cPLA2 family phospholipase|uniref:patatin-like phospholipase family protein n=1 Tax=Tractidigestivibacter sp. TaxID=2847320 RepID=UPI003D92413B
MDESEQLESNVFDTALCFEGGGYRASYTSGFVNVLLENHVYFDFVCGISAGASHTVDYVSRDKWRVRASFMQLTDKRPEAGGVVSMLTGHGYFNADYDYVGCTLDGVMPFDWETFSANPARVAIQSVRADTGESVVWGREAMPAAIPMMEHVRASSTLPGIMNPTVVDGHVMFDGGLGEGAGLPTHMAEDAGFKRIVFVATRPRGYRKKAPTPHELRVYSAITRKYPAIYELLATRADRYNAAMEHLEKLERDGRAWVFRPDVMPVKSTTIDKPKLEQAYEMGYEQARRDFPAMMEWLRG